MPGGALVGIEVVHPVENAQQRRLAASGRTNECRHLAMVKRCVDVLQRAIAAVLEIQMLDRNLLAQAVDAHGCVGDGRYGERCYAVHDDFLCEARARAMMLKVST